MLSRLDINPVNVVLDDKLRGYVRRKIGRLDRYIPRAQREVCHGEVYLKEGHISGKKQCTCEAVLQLPGDTLIAKETTVNIYAATDIVQAKLKQQLQKHKQAHSTSRRRRLAARFRQRSA